VISPAQVGVGGLGIAARDVLDGFRANGWTMEFVGSPQPTWLGRLARRRPWRRWHLLNRELQRREIVSRVPATWSLAYAMPSFLPEGDGVKVLHQATRHPQVVTDALKRARTTGGRSFIAAPERRRLLRELRLADLIRCEARAVADELLERGVSKDRVVWAPPGVDLARYRPGTKREQLTVAVVGPLALWKGWDVTATLIREMQNDVRFVVVGGPVDSWSARLLDGLDVERSSDVAAVFAEAHAMVLPSVADGFAYVALEAMASGCVPLVSPMVGAAEVVREVDERLVVERPDFVEAARELLPNAPALAARARSVAERYERVGMAQQAAARVLERLDLLASADASAVGAS